MPDILIPFTSVSNDVKDLRTKRCNLVTFSLLLLNQTNQAISSSVTLIQVEILTKPNNCVVDDGNLIISNVLHIISCHLLSSSMIQLILPLISSSSIWSLIFLYVMNLFVMVVLHCFLRFLY